MTVTWLTSYNQGKRCSVYMWTAEVSWAAQPETGGIGEGGGWVSWREMRDVCRECTGSSYAESTNLSVGLPQNAMYAWIVYWGKLIINIDCKATATYVYCIYVCILKRNVVKPVSHCWTRARPPSWARQSNGIPRMKPYTHHKWTRIHMLVKIHTRIHTYICMDNACPHAHTACTYIQYINVIQIGVGWINSRCTLVRFR